MYKNRKAMFNLRFFNGYELSINPTFCYLKATANITSLVNMILSLSQDNRMRFYKLLTRKMKDGNEL